MRKIVLGLAAVSALAVAAPAAAQYSRSYEYRGDPVERRLDQLRARIDMGVRRGAISPIEARRLLDELYRLRRLEDDYDRNGLSARERGELQQRLMRLRDQLRYAEGNGPYPGSGAYERGYDWDDDGWDDRGYDPDRDRQGQVYDRNEDGWDDRDRDRDGSWTDDQPYPNQTYPDQTYPGQSFPDRIDPNQPYPGDSYPGDDGYDPDDRYDADDRYDPDGDGYHENGAPIDPRAADDDWRDDDDDSFPIGAGGVLRVGDRAPEGMGAVPPEYRSRYRDGNGVYYRYDDGRVYQIDQRTGTVRWVGELPY